MRTIIVPYYDFNKDFPIARETEREIAGFLEERVGLKLIDECDNSDYDLLMEYTNGKRITIEVKEDFTCARTGNVGVEYECRGKPSGIKTTKSDFYLYKIHRPDGKITVAIIKTDDLKDMIRRGLYFRKVNGGDPGSNSMNYLFKLDVVLEHFMNLGTL